MPRRTASKAPRPRRGPDPELVHQFLVVLAHTDPVIWRRIQVPGDYSFWDLHVAIQDAMGWLDYHLHEFTVSDPEAGDWCVLGVRTRTSRVRTNRIRIGRYRSRDILCSPAHWPCTYTTSGTTGSTS
jgi:hypothetical protein